MRERYEAWINNTLRKYWPDLEPALCAAIDAYDSIQQAGTTSEDTLRPIIEAACSSRRPLYENVTGLLGALAEQFTAARDAVEKMSIDRRSQVRLNAILCLTKAMPASFSMRLLRQALCDKSAVVREKAADWAGRLRMRQLVPDLEAAFRAEKRAATRDTIEFEMRLLRDGYIFKPAKDSGYFLTTYTKQGVKGRFVRQSDVDSRGLDAIIQEQLAEQ